MRLGLISGGLAALAGLLGLPLITVLVGDGDTAPSASAVGDIPPAMLARYRNAAATCPGLDWSVLAAVGKVETDHGRLDAPGVASGTNFAGAAGPMQFLAGTWAAYGVDGNNDGRRDIYNPGDAIPAAAGYLCASGAGNPATLRRALWSYNHSQAYVTRVLDIAAGYGAESSAAGSGDGSAARTAVAFAATWIGTPYRWGGADANGFDCSGLVQAAYTAAGIQLPRVAQDQYDTGPHVTAGEELRPGDLVFYGTTTRSISHVGIYIGHGQMIDAPRTGALVRVEPSQRSSYRGATRPGA